MPAKSCSVAEESQRAKCELDDTTVVDHAARNTPKYNENYGVCPLRTAFDEIKRTARLISSGTSFALAQWYLWHNGMHTSAGKKERRGMRRHSKPASHDTHPHFDT